MQQSDPLTLVRPGSIARPGTIGRLIRLLMGLLCLYALWMILRHAGSTSMLPISTLDKRLLLVLVPLCLFNYVVNIGFSKSWGHRPLMVSVGLLGVTATAAFVLTGSVDSPIFGISLNAWLAYFFGHLGLSFTLAALIATPGCEMRAIPELLGRINGRPSPEHACPVSFIGKIDEWERRKTGD